MKFSDKLAKLRKANNLSQEQLADKLDISRQSVSKWESGDTYPDMTKLIQLCSILNCTLPELMDDGTFDEEFKPKDKEKSGFSSYINSFLDSVTKTYNMFIHMSGKSKLICLIEMLLIGGVLSLIDWIFPEFLILVFNKVFRYVPYGYTISSVLSDVFGIALIVLSVIVFIHLFKIRYLDYYVTITDNTISEQVEEKPIEENSNQSALDEKPKKEKVVIRDPKHSISHFLDGIGKIFVFLFKIFVVLCAMPALLCAVGFAYLTAIMMVNVVYSSVFTFASICLIGCTIICFVLVYMAINFLFKRKQPGKVLVLLFLSGLLLIGIGAGLATDKALSLYVVSDDYQVNYETKEFNYKEEDIENGLLLEFECYDIERVIDDTKQGVTIQMQIPDDIMVTSGEFIDEERLDYDETNIINTNGKKGVYYHYSYTKGIAHDLFKIKNDIKNGYIRENYGNPYSVVKVKVIMSQETSDKVKIIYY